MHILVVNGPNMNMLGIRQPEIYGHETYEDLKALIRAEADRLGVSVSFFQSNHEGALVDAIQQAYFDHVDGIIINPAAYTHTSVALLDAVKAVAMPPSLTGRHMPGMPLISSATQSAPRLNSCVSSAASCK